MTTTQQTSNSAKPPARSPTRPAKAKADPIGAPVAPAEPVVADEPPVLGANPFVGLTRQQIAAALGRLVQRLIVEPGVAVACGVEGAGPLVQVAVGRSDIA